MNKLPISSIGLLVVMFVMMAGQATFAMDDRFTKLLTSLPSSTAAIIEIRDPKAVVEYLESTGGKDDRTNQRFREWLVDPAIGLLKPKELDRIIQLKNEICSEMKEIKSIVVIVHTLETSTPMVSIAFDAEQKVVDSVGRKLNEIVLVVKKLQSTVRQQKAAEGDLKEAGKEMNRSWKSAEYCGYRVIGNYFNGNPPSVQRKRSLIHNRRFTRTWQHTNHQNASVKIYAAPTNLRKALFWIGNEFWRAFRVKEIVGVGCWLEFGEKNGDRFIEGKASLVFTVPRTGISRMWNAAKELAPIPKVGLPFSELSCENVDSTKRERIKHEIKKAAFPDRPSFHQRRIDFYKKSGLDYEQEVLPERNEKLTLRYFKDLEEGSQDIEYLVAKKVKKYAVAKTLADTTFKNANRNLATWKKWVRTFDEGSERLIYSESDLCAKRKFEEQKKRNPQQTLVLRKEAHILSKEWHVLGIFKGVEKFLDCLEKPESVDYADQVREHVQRIARSQLSEYQVYAVEVFSPLSWMRVNEYPLDQWIVKNKDFEYGKERPGSKKENVAALQTAILSMILDQFGNQVRVYGIKGSNNAIAFIVDGSLAKNKIFDSTLSKNLGLDPFRYYAPEKRED